MFDTRYHTVFVTDDGLKVWCRKRKEQDLLDAKSEACKAIDMLCATENENELNAEERSQVDEILGRLLLVAKEAKEIINDDFEILFKAKGIVFGVRTKEG